MTASRRFTLLSTLTLSTLAPLSVAIAQVVPSVENAKFGAAGVVNANSVAVHSGPGENYYPTTRLAKGDTVTVVGVKFNWLKVLPPEGSFSFVAKRFIDKTGDTTGVANGANVNIRVGSTLSPMKTAIQTQLQKGDKVEILGELEEYYKIKPPTGAYLYINQQYVDASKMLGPTADIVKPATPSNGSVAVTPPATPGAVIPTDGTTAVAPQPTDTTTIPAVNGIEIGNGKTDPNAVTAEKLTKAAPTTKPSAEITAAIDTYTQAEKDFLAASNQSIDQQPLAQLTQTYTALAASDKLPGSMRANAKARLETLQLRAEAQQGVLALRQRQEEFEKRTAALAAEQQALQAKLSSNRVLVYTAMGQLSTSSLKLGDTPVYRLIDPANGRTLVYIRGNDPSLSGMLNQYVGIKGDVVTDPQLSVSIITPKSIESVDPSTTDASAAQIHPLSSSTSSKTTVSTSDK